MPAYYSKGRNPTPTIRTLIVWPRFHDDYIFFIEDPNFMAMRALALFFHWSLPLSLSYIYIIR
jgi:hypothetical protein